MTEPKRVVIIEDEPGIADSLIYALETDGFTPDWQATGQAGLESVRQNPPAAVILDVGLPDINGFELCRQLRKESDVPVLFLTARGDEIDRVAGLEIGGDDYIVKPFSPREVAARIRVILRRMPSVDSNDSAGITLDTAAQQIVYFGQPLALSRYEFRLLEWFATHPNRLYSREQLLQQIWDHPEHVTDRTVDTHIKQLRSKLKAVNSELDPIQTRRGMGYVYNPGK